MSPAPRAAVSALVLVATLVLTACGGAEPGDGGEPAATPSLAPTGGPTDDPTSRATEDPTGGPTVDPTAVPTGEPGDSPSLAAEVRAAVDDLVDRTGTDPAEVRVVVYEQVIWPDGSIGCPEPGMSYTQALVEGRRLILAADGTEFAYHGGADGPLRYCATPRPALEETETR